MPVHVFAFVPFGNIRQKMSGVKRKFFVDLHLAANVAQDGKMPR